jgi:hypothetical protein
LKRPTAGHYDGREAAVTRVFFVLAIVVCGVAVRPLPATAAESDRLYAGGPVGISTLSADARTVVSSPNVSVSLYKPENGAAVSGVVGVHLYRFVSIQANYIGNRNRVTLVSAVISPSGGHFDEQARSTAQHALVGDVLIYVRALESVVRPYFSVGVGVVRFDSDQLPLALGSDLEPALEHIASTRAGLRVAVGIDVTLGGGWSFRYSFSDAMSRNPVSSQLSPRGQRSLANFQSLFGLVRRL